jgi:MOSC domain-containing protein YiiM
MRLVSVNVASELRPLVEGRRKLTGFDKRPVSGRVEVGREGLGGDAIASKRHHGGPGQAVYLYTCEDYAWWSQELGRTLGAGAFGENLTIEGAESASLAIGDHFEVGPDVLLQVTSPRIPCDTLALRMGDPSFLKRFVDAKRPGAYARVLQSGTVGAGDTIVLRPAEGPSLPLLDGARLFWDRKAPESELRAALAAPLAERFRADIEKRLAQP